MKKNTLVTKSSFLDSISPKKHILGLVFLSICISLFFTIFKYGEVPPCMNADEAAFGYNAYSLLKTGADEYGNTLPFRLKSFGDYKMPLYTYLSIPFVGVLGLNEFSVAALNVLLAILFPLVMYFFAKELLAKDEVGAIAAILTSTSLGIGILARHAHEALLAAFLLTLTSYFFIRYIKEGLKRDAVFFVSTLTLALFSYQSSRLFAVFYFVALILYFFIKRKFQASKKFVLILLIIGIGFFAITDVLNKPARVESLFLTNSLGFSMRINELITEGGSRIFYNKLTVGVRDVLLNHTTYYSPQFLAINGDTNYRFGFPKMSPMTLLEYVFIFVGMYFLFRNKERWRYFILGLFLISPLTAALSWADTSLTRSYFLLIPAIILSAYGMFNILALSEKRNLFVPSLLSLLLIQSFFLYYAWDFYLNHYPKRAAVIRSWQCGYAELGVYIKDNYNKFDTFYITQKHGQPYIFTLFYLQFPPAEYQKQASLSGPDEFGFGQVEKYDKFEFNLPATAITKKHAVLIGYPEDFGQFNTLDTKRIKKIIIGTEEIFWIYETQ